MGVGESASQRDSFRVQVASNIGSPASGDRGAIFCGEMMMNYHDMKPFDEDWAGVHKAFLSHFVATYAPCPPLEVEWQYCDIPFGAQWIKHRAVLIAQNGDESITYEFYIVSTEDGEPLAMIFRECVNGVVGDQLAFVQFYMRPWAKDTVMQMIRDIPSPLTEKGATH